MRRQIAESQADSGPRVAAVIVAGGDGERFGASGGKQLARVAGLPVLGHTLKAFERSALVTEVVVVVHPDRVEEYGSQALVASRLSKPASVVAGADTRQGSVRAGLSAVSSAVEIIAVHDGARPLVTAGCIDEAIAAVLREPIDGAVVGHPAYDTLKTVDGLTVTGTPDRTRFWVAQTPQVFDAHVLREAYDRASATGSTGTDDAMLVELIGGVVRMIEGPRDNIKVTVAEDLGIVAAVLQQREGS